MTKPMTAQQIQAIDWAAILTKLPAFAALIAQLLALLQQPQPSKTAACQCPSQVEEASHAAMATLAAHVLAQLKLHECIGCCDE